MKTQPANPDQQKTIVVGVGLKSDDILQTKESLAELEELCLTAGAEVVGSLFQTLEKFNPALLLGSGKVAEIRELVEETEATLVVVDHPLSGVQSRNLEKELEVPVLDRAQLILDIFAQRASTHEGKLQVELAQLLDLMPRQVGAWLGSLSRQGGGIGTRGPGETALEVDRRRVRERVKVIRAQLKQVQKSRSQHRSLRKKSQVPSFALIGYTNAGKSTLLNTLTDAKVYTKDQLFATLDPTTRKVHLPKLGNAVMTDTVGFIRKLPTHLIDAFKATLEESGEADVLLHVVDLSSQNMEAQIGVVEDLIEEFGWSQKPIIYVFNKLDVAPPRNRFQISQAPRVLVSAQTGDGLDKLKLQMVEALKSLDWKQRELFIPLSEKAKVFQLHEDGRVHSIEEGTTGSICKVSLPDDLLEKWRDYLV